MHGELHGSGPDVFTICRPHRHMPPGKILHAVKAAEQLSPTAQHFVEKSVDSLATEFGGRQSRATIERIMDDSLEQLVGRGHDVSSDDFVPTLAHRFTRERLKALDRVHEPAGRA